MATKTSSRPSSRPLPSLSLSPSIAHQALMKKLKPSLAFDGNEQNSNNVRAWQNRLRRKLSDCLGVPQNDGVPLKPRTLWKREHELGTIEKIAFTAEAGSDVVAYLCLPSNAEAPYTTMICLQGHSTGMHNSIGVDREDETQTIEVPGDRDFGLQCMRHGVAALCIEQRSFGERREQHQEHRAAHGCQDAAMHALMLGRTLVGERVFDVDRGLDYLATRPEINQKKIGVMGNSGGGTVSIYSIALLPRLRFAMPSCAFCTYRDSIMPISHCVDNYIPGLLQYAESADVLGLAAPKPVVVVAGRDDEIFPISGTRSEFRRLQKVYKAMDAAANCKLVIGDGGHRFYADDAWPHMLKMIEKL